jgi:hypothetical protein
MTPVRIALLALAATMICGASVMAQPLPALELPRLPKAPPLPAITIQPEPQGQAEVATTNPFARISPAAGSALAPPVTITTNGSADALTSISTGTSRAISGVLDNAGNAAFRLCNTRLPSDSSAPLPSIWSSPGESCS